MKKVIFSIVATMFLISCGSSTKPVDAVDTTQTIDSSIMATDTAVAHIILDSTTTK